MRHSTNMQLSPRGEEPIDGRGLQPQPLPPQPPPPPHLPSQSGHSREIGNLELPANFERGAALQGRELQHDPAHADHSQDSARVFAEPPVGKHRVLVVASHHEAAAHSTHKDTGRKLPSKTSAHRLSSLGQGRHFVSSIAAETQHDSASSANTGGERAAVFSTLLPSNDAVNGTPNFFEWKQIFPELEMLVHGFPDILEECTQVSDWKAWPEKHSAEGVEHDWKVFPFVHTFPANDESRRTWIESTCSLCPATTKILRRVPNIRTALFSRLGGGSRISGHRGWADLANHVLRCHFALKVPSDGPCGLWVNGEIAHHAEGEIVVFDDSKLHRAFNDSTRDRVILIVDILRPEGVALGTAEGDHTPELNAFIDAFR